MFIFGSSISSETEGVEGMRALRCGGVEKKPSLFSPHALAALQPNQAPSPPGAPIYMCFPPPRGLRVTRIFTLPQPPP